MMAACCGNEKCLSTTCRTWHNPRVCMHAWMHMWFDFFVDFICQLWLSIVEISIYLFSQLRCIRDGNQRKHPWREWLFRWCAPPFANFQWGLPVQFLDVFYQRYLFRPCVFSQWRTCMELGITTACMFCRCKFVKDEEEWMVKSPGPRSFNRLGSKRKADIVSGWCK